MSLFLLDDLYFYFVFSDPDFSFEVHFDLFWDKEDSSLIKLGSNIFEPFCIILGFPSVLGSLSSNKIIASSSSKDFIEES